MAVDIKQAYRRLIEESFGNGNFGIYDELCAKDYVGHDPLSGVSDLAKTKQVLSQYKVAFPDLTPTILATFAQDDTVILQWRMVGTHQAPLMGIQPTGNRCTVEGISIGHFKAGRLVEDWAQWDALGLMRQLGVAPNANLGTGRTARPERPSRA